MKYEEWEVRKRRRGGKGISTKFIVCKGQHISN